MKPLLIPSQGPSHVTTLELITLFQTLGASQEEGRHFPPVLHTGPSLYFFSILLTGAL